MSGSKVPRQTAAVCAAAAAVAFVGLLGFGQPRAGISLGAGLLLGGINGLLAARSAEAGGAFRFLSLVRIGLLSAVALGLGVLLEPATAYLTLVGIGASLFLMSGLAARALLRR